MSSERLERLDAMLQGYIDDDMVAGVVSLVARDGKVVHHSALGSRYVEGGASMEEDALFVIMSMTKPIVSTALMMLFEEGYFLLDDPISKYAPEFADKTVLVDGQGGAQRVPADRPITFRHILTHTAGVDPSRDLLTEDERALMGRQGPSRRRSRRAVPCPSRSTRATNGATEARRITWRTWSSGSRSAARPVSPGAHLRPARPWSTRTTTCPSRS